MNKLFSRLLIMGIVFIFPFGCSNSSTKLEGVIDIKDFRNTQKPENDLIIHKPNFIEINRVMFIQGEAYEVNYYQNENDSIKNHRAYYGSNEDYNKAAYKWVNDTTVSIRLFNEISKKEVTFKAFGNGNMSGMSTD